jgi:hypothetical protein
MKTFMTGKHHIIRDIHSDTRLCADSTTCQNMRTVSNTILENVTLVDVLQLKVAQTVSTRASYAGAGCEV